jgi:putative transposase
VKYACIEKHRQAFEIRLMCRVLSVSRSSFYAWKKRGPSQREQRDKRLRSLIRIVHRTSKHATEARECMPSCRRRVRSAAASASPG